MKRSSLAARLLVWILPLTLAALTAVAASTYLVARGTILREVEQGVQGLAQIAASEVRAFVEQRNNDLATIGQSPLFRDHYQNVEYGLGQEAGVYRKEIERMLATFAHRAKVYPRLSYLDASGRVVCSVWDRIPGPTESAAADAEFFRRLKGLKPGQRLFSPPRRVAWHRYPVTAYGAPLYDEFGRLRGALVFDSSMGVVYEMLGRLRLGLSGHSYIAERRADVPSDGRARQVGDFLAASIAVAGSPWVAVTTVRRSEFLDSLQYISTATLLLGGFVGLIVMIVIILQVRLLLRPIHALSTAANAYASGDLDIRVAIEGPHETAALAEAFNLMAGRLKRRTEDLVLRVRELTALHRMNDAVLRRLGRSEIGASCLEAAITGLGFERGMLFWVDEDRGEASGECVYDNQSVRSIRDRRVPLGHEGVLSEVVRRRAPVTLKGAPGEPRCSAELLQELKAQSLCLAPVIAGERVIAVIIVDLEPGGKPVSSPQMRSFSLFCGAAGLALENARLLDRILGSENRYRTAVENSPHAVVSLDQNLRVTLWNRRAEALFGYQPTEAFGRTLAFLFGEKPYQGLKRRVEVEGSLRLAEVTGRTRDGRPLDLTVSWAGQAPASSSAREWFVVIQDETEKKRLQSQLIQAEKMSAVGNLIAGVAHELNNPLAAVAGFAELLKGLPTKPEEAEDLRLLHASALRCRDIVQGLLSFARQGAAVRSRVPLNDAVQAAVALSEYRLIKAEGITLEIALDPASPEVAGSSQRLQQVLINLLNNASDALKGRLGPRVVRVRTLRTGASCLLEVEDTGPGVPDRDRAKVFDPFFTTKPAGMGTGLGLSISAQIVAEAGGSLSCGSGPEGGARFTLSFPPCPADVHRPEESSDLPPPAPGRRVLIIDDEQDLVTLMAHLLRQDGMEAVPALGPEDGMRLAAAEDFDLIITDMDMGRLRGSDVRQAARAAGSKAAFLFVTGDVLNKALQHELEAFGDPLLAKPFLRMEFLRQVRRVLAVESGAA